ncbi:MAG: DUF5106 domain-containing protein [Prevotella sp.]|nr:DUF5106 domain-containing protein [Prevotella sp.]
MKRWQLLFLLACPCAALAQSFSYPVPPDSIGDRQGRIAYMVSHFWNEQSIGDTANFQSPRLLLDYLYLLKQETTNLQSNSIKSFVSLAYKNEQTFGRILYWLDQILYDSSSPHYNEDIYLRLMTEVVTSDADSVMKLIPMERVKMMSKNQIGKPTNDFCYVDKEDNQHKLYDVDAPLLLLVFNNPDCSLCCHAEKAMIGNTLIQNLQKKGLLSVLAVAPDADFKEWKKHKYPSSWLTGIDKGGVIYRNRLYDIQRLPCIYLLDKDKQVLLKEADYGRLSVYLEEHYATFCR